MSLIDYKIKLQGILRDVAEEKLSKKKALKMAKSLFNEGIEEVIDLVKSNPRAITPKEGSHDLLPCC